MKIALTFSDNSTLECNGNDITSASKAASQAARERAEAFKKDNAQTDEKMPTVTAVTIKYNDNETKTFNNNDEDSLLYSIVLKIGEPFLVLAVVDSGAQLKSSVYQNKENTLTSYNKTQNNLINILLNRKKESEQARENDMSMISYLILSGAYFPAIIHNDDLEIFSDVHPNNYSGMDINLFALAVAAEYPDVAVALLQISHRSKFLSIFFNSLFSQAEDLNFLHVACLNNWTDVIQTAFEVVHIRSEGRFYYNGPSYSRGKTFDSKPPSITEQVWRTMIKNYVNAIGFENFLYDRNLYGMITSKDIGFDKLCEVLDIVGTMNARRLFVSSQACRLEVYNEGAVLPHPLEKIQEIREAVAAANVQENDDANSQLMKVLSYRDGGFFSSHTLIDDAPRMLRKAFEGNRNDSNTLVKLKQA